MRGIDLPYTFEEYQILLDNPITNEIPGWCRAGLGPTREQIVEILAMLEGPIK